jgi:hypothetical protein
MQKALPISFVARRRTPVQPCESAGPEHRYDPIQQLWVNAESGEVLVMQHVNGIRSHLAASDFGETTLTRTIEGADQSEGRVSDELTAPDTSFGARTISASPFGETSLTETSEGIDQSERISQAE